MGGRGILKWISWKKILKYACQAHCQQRPSRVTRLRLEGLEDRRIAGSPLAQPFSETAR
jgi:hypothetical protein